MSFGGGSSSSTSFPAPTEQEEELLDINIDLARRTLEQLGNVTSQFESLTPQIFEQFGLTPTIETTPDREVENPEYRAIKDALDATPRITFDQDGNQQTNPVWVQLNNRLNTIPQTVTEEGGTRITGFTENEDIVRARDAGFQLQADVAESALGLGAESEGLRAGLTGTIGNLERPINAARTEQDALRSFVAGGGQEQGLLRDFDAALDDDIQSARLTGAGAVAGVAPRIGGLENFDRRLVEDQLMRILQGGPSASDIALVNQATSGQIAAGLSDIDANSRRQLEILREELAPARGLRSTDTPILDRGARVAEEATRQSSRLIDQFRSQAAEQLLQLPLQRQDLGLRAASSAEGLETQRRQSALTGAVSAGGLGLSAEQIAAGLASTDATVRERALEAAGRLGLDRSIAERDALIAAGDIGLGRLNSETDRLRTAGSLNLAQQEGLTGQQRTALGLAEAAANNRLNLGNVLTNSALGVAAGSGSNPASVLASLQATRRAGGTTTTSQTPGALDIIGGIGSVAGFLSDRRLKRDVVRVGRLRNGLAVYRYRFAGESEIRHGVMADEVAAVKPEAVSVGPHGYMRVDYDQILEAA